MAEIINVNKIKDLATRLKRQKKLIVLAGGCFDILHPGHIIFLEKAKSAGDILVIILESDQKIRELKGLSRPVHRQIDRAKILSALSCVDYIIMLPYIKNNLEYDVLIEKIRPDTIAVTRGEGISHHQRVAKLVDAKINFVTDIIGNYSSSDILNHKK